MTDIGKTLLIFSAAGPCLSHAAGGGKIVRETSHFWFTQIRENDPVKRVSKKNSMAHTEPCCCCRDHAKTSYPEGYMD